MRCRQALPLPRKSREAVSAETPGSKTFLKKKKKNVVQKDIPNAKNIEKNLYRYIIIIIINMSNYYYYYFFFLSLLYHNMWKNSKTRKKKNNNNNDENKTNKFLKCKQKHVKCNRR